MFNEGIWNAQTKTWEGSAIRRTMEGDEARYTGLLLGTPSLHGRILLGGLALGPARPSTRPTQTCGTCCRPSTVHIRVPTR